MSSREMSMDTIMEDDESFASNTNATIYGVSYISGRTESLISDPNILKSSSTSEDDHHQHQISTNAGDTSDDLIVSSCASSKWFTNNSNKEGEVRIFNVDFRALLSISPTQPQNYSAQAKASSFRMWKSDNYSNVPARNQRQSMLNKSIAFSRKLYHVMGMQMPNVGSNQNMAPARPTQSWVPPPSSFPGGGPGFGPSTQYMPPARQFDNYFPPVDMPTLEKKPSYSRGASMGTYDTNVQTQQSVVTKVTQNMQIALSDAHAVIGTSGSTIRYILQASGAFIAIQGTRGDPDEMTVEITGSASQVQTAQQLIQNSIADAASSMQNTTARHSVSSVQ